MLAKQILKKKPELNFVFFFFKIGFKITSVKFLMLGCLHDGDFAYFEVPVQDVNV